MIDNIFCLTLYMLFIAHDRFSPDLVHVYFNRRSWSGFLRFYTCICVFNAHGLWFSPIIYMYMSFVAHGRWLS